MKPLKQHANFKSLECENAPKKLKGHSVWVPHAVRVQPKLCYRSRRSK